MGSSAAPPPPPPQPASKAALDAISAKVERVRFIFLSLLVVNMGVAVAAHPED